tara:strand:+ start:1746 stop:2225 length:480 start_codon:yes stop_codon:yes gene_type:complete
MKKQNNKKFTSNKLSTNTQQSIFHNYKFSKFSIINFVSNLNTNKLFIGIMMIFMNLGSRYIEIKLTKSQENILKNIAREVLIFTIAFVGSRDIVIAFIITAVFMILSKYIFNENSRFNILPKRLKELESSLDLDGDGKVSDKEIEQAIELLKKANKNKK